MSKSVRMQRLLMVLLAAGLVLAGCASVPVYRPAPTANDYGYRNTALTASRFRVSFAGGYGVARETVENLALFRAAQVTLSHGATRFRVVSSDTTRVTGHTGPSAAVGYGYGMPFWGTGIMLSHRHARARYETLLEIVVQPDLPVAGAHVYDARQVKRHLAALANTARN